MVVLIDPILHQEEDIFQARGRAGRRDAVTEDGPRRLVGPPGFEPGTGAL